MTTKKEPAGVSNLYSTSDLALAATISLWYPLVSIDRIQDSRKVHFLFKRSENLNQLVESFWKKELKVDPQTYFSQLKALKARLYETE